MAPLGCRLALLLPPRNTCRLAAAGTRTPPRHGVHVSRCEPRPRPQALQLHRRRRPLLDGSVMLGGTQVPPCRPSLARRHTFFTSDLRQIRSR